MPFEFTNWENDLSDEAKQLLHKILPKYNQKLSEIKKLPISILIWGPSPTSESAIGQIRKLLREKLRKDGNLAMFSEELCDEDCGFSIRLQQLVQAEQYDLIISIPETPGAIGEIHDFASDTRINNKILIFANKKYATGYSVSSLESISCLLSAEVVMYDDDSIDSIITYSLNTVNKIKEYKYITGGRY